MAYTKPRTQPAHGPGLFIALEGIDGCGKTTQRATVAEWFLRRGFEVVHVREPGGTPLGERLRSVFLECKKDHSSVPLTDVLMLVAAKYALYHNVVEPALKAGKVVIADRWTPTLYAYQGGGFGVGKNVLGQILHATGLDACTPDLVLFVDVRPEVAAQRLATRGEELSALDKLPLAFFRRVRATYRKQTYEHGPQQRINGEALPGQVAASIERALKKRLADLL